MKHSSFKKVLSVSAFAVLAVAVSSLFNNTQADDGTTTLSGSGCATSAAPTTFDVDFGSFNGSNVLNDQYLLTGTLGGNSKTYVATSTSTGQITTGLNSSDQFISVLDTCGNTGWTATVLFSDMTSSGLPSTFYIPGDAIKLVNSSTLYYLGSTPQTLNNEVKAVSGSDGGDAGGDSNEDLVFNGTANPDSLNDAASWESPLTIMQRVYGGNMLAGEFGVKPTVSIFVPQYQPAGTYNGTITVTLQ